MRLAMVPLSARCGQLLCFCFVFLFCGEKAFAANTQLITTDRYTTVQAKPLDYQVNPLLATVEITFPQHVKTVGDGVSYLLRYSGYSLQNKQHLSKEVLTTLNKPLPFVDKKLGPLSLQDALTVLMGQHVFTLVQDPIHREVGFELNQNIKNAVTTS